MTWRMVLTGPECTGKTTLAQAIAERLRAPWVPEASRAYAETRHGVLTAADVEPIARATRDALHRAAADQPPVLVADTDLVSTLVYARAYYGACPAWIEQSARTSWPICTCSAHPTCRGRPTACATVPTRRTALPCTPPLPTPCANWAPGW